MLSSHSDEFRLIQAVAAGERPNAAVTVGIGDDAAVMADGTLVATDTLLEGTHYTSDADPVAVGHKAIAVNLSDIAAMGGTAVAATVALSLRRSPGAAERGAALMRGLQQTASRFGVSIIGGDTTSWDAPEAITVTVLGREPSGGAILRSGARPGDHLYVTGPLGGSLAGRHLRFTPRLHEVATILPDRPKAMIDISDGLASDAAHVAASSGVGVLIEADLVPVHDDVPLGCDRLQAALTDGEDFELLFAVSPNTQPSIGIRIGTVTDGTGVHLETNDGSTTELRPQGYSHRLDHGQP